jgi:hypothetical protein
MKIWHGYGSDHSANLVMIGEFKTQEDAERAYQLIEVLRESASSDLSEDVVHVWARNEQFSDATESKLRELKLNLISPDDIADFAFLCVSIEKSGATLRLHTDDVDIGGFVKLMVDQGAKVHVYSAHTYPENDGEKS